MSVYDEYYEKQLLAAFYFVTCVFGLLGNSIVLLAVVFSRKPRNATNVFVVNLALSDLITCMFLPVMILGLLSESREKLLVPPTLCAVSGFVMILGNPCSFNAIAAIALLRASITGRLNRPSSRNPFPPRVLAAMVSFIWLLPLTMCSLPILSDFGDFGYDENYSTCSFRPTSPRSKIYSLAVVVSCYPVQLTLTVTSYATIFRTIIRGSRRVNTHSVSVVGGEMRVPLPLLLAGRERPDGPTSQSSSQDTDNTGGQPASGVPTRRAPLGGNPHAARRNRTVTLNMLLVVAVFAACTAPYCICILTVSDRHQKFLPFLGGLLVFNSCVNPAIYIARHPDFKQVCRCILLCRLSKIPMKSDLLRRLLNTV